MLRKLSISRIAGRSVRQHKTDNAYKAGQVPAWWDLSVDCGWSDKWYKCRNCDTCLGHLNRPNWDTLHNWDK